MTIASMMMPNMAAMTNSAMNRPRQFFTSDPMKSCYNIIHHVLLGLHKTV